MSGRVAGKVALITGAGDGIGKATAKLLAEEGAAIVAVDIVETNVIRTVQEIRAAGGQAISCTADVSTEEGTLGMVDAAVKQYGRLDILHNNAGIGGPFLPAHELPIGAWDKVIATNLRSVFLGSKAAINVMLPAGKGVIVNTASTFAKLSTRNLPAYHASKGAVLSFTKQLALQYGPTIRVNCVSPGTIETGALRIAINSDPDPVAREAHYRQTNPVLGRIGDPREIAYGVLFLSSDESSFVVGHDLVMGGGQGLAASPVD